MIAKTKKAKARNASGSAKPDLLAAALAYASNGYPVVPIRAGEKKPPYIKNWPSRATTDADVVRRWWAAHPDANIAIATGVRSKLLVVDVDPRNGGFATLKALIKKRGAFPRTLTANTPSGGKHYFFKMNRELKNSAGKLGPGVDVRCEGGYVVVAPSVVGGKAYAWSV